VAFGLHSFSLERRALRTGPTRLSGKHPNRRMASRRFALPGGRPKWRHLRPWGPGETNDIVPRARGPLAFSVQPAAQAI
jgi:hypothetical protein